MTRTTPTMPTTRLLLPLSLAALGAASLVGCGEDSAGTDSTVAAATDVCAQVTVRDAYANATDGQMTGSFGVIVNDSDTEVTVVSASTNASGTTELHEVVEADGEMAMQRIEGGFAVPANGSHTLQPGGDHVMVMDLADGLEPGEEVDITLALDAGCDVAYTALVKDAEGGDESYHQGHGGAMDGAGHGGATDEAESGLSMSPGRS